MIKADSSRMSQTKDENLFISTQSVSNFPVGTDDVNALLNNTFNLAVSDGLDKN